MVVLNDIVVAVIASTWLAKLADPALPPSAFPVLFLYMAQNMARTTVELRDVSIPSFAQFVLPCILFLFVSYGLAIFI